MAKKISLKEKLQMLTHLSFSFIGINQVKTKEGDYVAILQLAEPIPYVRGSQEVELDGKTWPVAAKDVKEIKVHEGDFSDDFEFDEETDLGTYNGSGLMLDVAKNGQVWLRKESFASAGNTMRTVSRNQRLAKLVGAPIPGVSEPAKGAGRPVEPVNTP